MFSFSDLSIPLVGAPMAGGPSSPELVAAVSAEGGLGMIGAGYYDATALRSHVEQVRSLLNSPKIPFGVNLFAPQAEQGQDAAGQLAAYRQALAPVGARLGVDTESIVVEVPDHFEALIVWLVENPVAVVTFTFGLPPEGVIERLHNAGVLVGITVTKPDAAVLSQDAGANFLTVQGPDAGGHQSTFTIEEETNSTPLPNLVAAIRAVTDVPLVAGGGVGSAEDFRAVLSLGVEAVQVGSLLLLADEAGTNAVYRQALLSGEYKQTRITRAFTGRPARALVNDFVKQMDPVAPAVYPEIHYLTAPLRAEAKKQGKYEYLNLWAGNKSSSIRRTSTKEIINLLIK